MKHTLSQQCCRRASAVKICCQLMGFLLFSSLLISGCSSRGEGAVSLPPPHVEVVEAIQKDVSQYSEWVGTLDGFVNTNMRAQVSGYLVRQSYKEGDFVRQGQILFEIDPRPFKAALDKAEGQLGEAKAHLGKTEQDVKRYTPLAKEGAISRQELDDAVQANLAAKASVYSAEAAVEQAKLNLGFTKVISPVDGIAGRANAQLGNLVGPDSSSELTTVSRVDPIKAYIQLSEQEYLTIARRTEDKYHPRSVQLFLTDGSLYPHQGKIDWIDRQVDVATGTIKAAVLFPNPGNILRPGGYARVRIEKEVRKNAVLVPQRAVSELQGSYQVAVVDKDQTVSIRNVQVGDRADSMWLINEGIEPGERVIVEGLLKVSPGMRVESALPSDKPAASNGA